MKEKKKNEKRPQTSQTCKLTSQSQDRFVCFVNTQMNLGLTSAERLLPLPGGGGGEVEPLGLVVVLDVVMEQLTLAEAFATGVALEGVVIFLHQKGFGRNHRQRRQQWRKWWQH